MDSTAILAIMAFVFIVMILERNHAIDKALKANPQDSRDKDIDLIKAVMSGNKETMEKAFLVIAETMRPVLINSIVPELKKIVLEIAEKTPTKIDDFVVENVEKMIVTDKKEGA